MFGVKMVEPDTLPELSQEQKDVLLVVSRCLIGAADDLTCANAGGSIKPMYSSDGRDDIPSRALAYGFRALAANLRLAVS